MNTAKESSDDFFIGDFTESEKDIAPSIFSKSKMLQDGRMSSAR